MPFHESKAMVISKPKPNTCIHSDADINCKSSSVGKKGVYLVMIEIAAGKNQRETKQAKE